MNDEVKRGRGRGRKIIEPMEEQIGQDGVYEFDEDGDEPVLVAPKMESVEDPAAADKLANMQFMEDMITIHVHDVAEDNADQVFMVGVNGKQEVFKRGETKTVKRYIVETLARAKPVRFRNQEFTMDDGTRAFRYPSNTGLRYPFSIVHDPHPKGADWIKAVLAQP